MPFQHHIIEPVKISQTPVSVNEKDELECCANLTLANLIRQLASLSQHASVIFEELGQDAIKIKDRTAKLYSRIDKLKEATSKLNKENEKQTILDDFYTLKHFKSEKYSNDPQIISKISMPKMLQVLYEKAEPPPDLNALAPFKDDSVEPLKSYTDPSFFFNNWRKKVSKANEQLKAEKRPKNNENHDELSKKKDEQTNDKQILYVNHPEEKLGDANVIVYDFEYKNKVDLIPTRLAPLPPALAAETPAIGIQSQNSELSEQLSGSNTKNLTETSSVDVRRSSNANTKVNHRMSVFDVLDTRQENDFSDDDDW